MEFLKSKTLVFLVSLITLVQCSTKKGDLSSDDLENAEVLVSDTAEEAAMSANEKAGFEMAQPEILTGGPPLIHFFPNKLSYGLLLNNFKWGQPLSPNNPGVDCKLKLKKVGPPTNIFSCVIKFEKEDPAVVTAVETLQGKDRSLVRVVLDSRGKGLRARWSQDIKSAGYRPMKGRKATFVSPDGRTLLEVVPSKTVLSAVFRPAAGSP